MTFAEDVARRKQSINSADSKAALAGLGAADVSLAAAERLTARLKAPPGVNLHAIKFVGHATTGIAAGAALYQAFKGGTEEDRALARQDLAFTGVGEAFPELAPIVSLPYFAGRAFRDMREAIEAAEPNILERAAEGSTCP